VPAPREEIHYRLNDQDEIVFVNQAWDMFASANAGEHLTTTHVLGRSLLGVHHGSHDAGLVPGYSDAGSERSFCSVPLAVRFAGVSQAVGDGGVARAGHGDRLSGPDPVAGSAAAATATRGWSPL
jgi:hypothetical protein